jgi:uncharacterized phosphatase
MTRIYLLRHGETAWNAEGNRYCGRTDLSLSETGRQQARQAAQALASAPLTAIYVSPLARSRETGEMIAAARDIPLRTDPRVVEIHFGEWEGLTSAEIARADPDSLSIWREDPAVVHAGRTGETGREVADRMQAFLHDIVADHPDAAVAVIGHSTASRLLLAANLGAPLANYRRLVLDNAGISILEAEGDAWRWLRINDVSHLKS